MGYEYIGYRKPLINYKLKNEWGHVISQVDNSILDEAVISKMYMTRMIANPKRDKEHMYVKVSHLGFYPISLL